MPAPVRPTRPELTYVIIKCADEEEARLIHDQIIDTHESVWPFLAYDDGFGHIVRVEERKT